MPDILSLEEKEALQGREQAQALRQLLDGEDDQVDLTAALALLERMPRLASRVMEICRSPERGFQGSRTKAAVASLGVGGFREVVIQAIEELLPGKQASRPARTAGKARSAPAPLTQEQIDARLRATEKPPQDGPPVVSMYDFKHPARVNKDQLRTLENLHDNFARLLSSTFSGAMHAVVDVDTAFVDQTTYAEFIMSLSNPACSYQFTLGPTNGQAIIDVAMPIVSAAVDRVFGGQGSPAGVDPRQMTPIEIGVINRIIKRVIEDLEATWEPLLRVEITDIELETNPEFMQVTAASEIVILLAFEVNSTNASGLISLCYPFFTLEPILPRLGQQTYVRRHAPDRERLMRDNRLRLGSMDLEMVAELGRTTIPLQQARQLRAGDVVRLPTRCADPIDLYLGGMAKFHARPFADEAESIRLKVVDDAPAR